ncbi:hypothetical protein [Aestuariibaculum lutulentum]|uniref:Sigma-70 family RNA polymerase sigma factor n=1 Tax=Aestuariibaculum lutulentum TaxID=2920935 RepID=A0ABS9RIW0_9FLAO|nr:hypothetical protein [Aestuariibaculum lutulentum]MCH4552883.1 hypothetical protein [Aestuariibaculum lutulentum]
MSTIDKLNDKATQIAFNKKVLSASQQLHPYVKHRLYIAESTGIIPRKMYSSNGVVDDTLVAFYEKGYDVDIDNNTLKLKLFKMVNTQLDSIYEKEAFHKNTISTRNLLEDELKALEEEYTIDDGFDYVMNEDLNDISYQQNGHDKHMFLYDDNNHSILNAFNTKASKRNNSQQVIGNIYSRLPINVSNIIDLYVFGKLTIKDIASIKHIEEKRIDTIINWVKKTFETNLD